MFKVGDRVKVTNVPENRGRGTTGPGSIGVVIDLEGYTYKVRFLTKDLKNNYGHNNQNISDGFQWSFQSHQIQKIGPASTTHLPDYL